MAESARQSIAATSPVDRDAFLRQLLSGLACVLTQHLEGQSGWSQWSWIDGILPESAATTADMTCEIWGLAIWSTDGPGEWVEPFAACVRLAPDGSLAEYELTFGDSQRGLGTVPYGARRRHLVRDNPPEWLFTFHWLAA